MKSQHLGDYMFQYDFSNFPGTLIQQIQGKVKILAKGNPLDRDVRVGFKSITF